MGKHLGKPNLVDKNGKKIKSVKKSRKFKKKRWLSKMKMLYYIGSWENCKWSLKTK